MNPLRVKLGIALVVGLGAGISVGVIYARHTIGMSNRRMSQWAAVGTYAALAHLQYRYADEQHARAALSDFLSFAQQAKTAGKISDGRAFGLDVAHAYMRLAGLDRRGGNMDGYQSNVSHAQEALRESSVRGTAVEENMERFLDQDKPQSVEVPKVK